MLIIELFKKIKVDDGSKKALALYLSLILNVLLGFFVSIINTRYLSIDDFGKLKFIQQLFQLTATVFSLGISYSVGRLMVKADADLVRILTGTTITINAILTICSGAILFILTFIIDDIVNINISNDIRLILPFLVIAIFQRFPEDCLQAINRIYSLALLRTLPSFFYIISCLVIIFSVNHISLINALVLGFGSIGIVICWVLATLKPTFKPFLSENKSIWKENSRNGFHVYVGMLCSVAVSNLVGMSLGFYLDMQAVAFFSLAITVTSPLVLLPTVVGTTFFKSFASQRYIPLSINIFTVTLTVASLIIFLLIIKSIVISAFSEKYLPVIPYINILAVGMLFHGLGDFFNKFLGSHGRGKELRNVAIFYGIILLLVSLLLVQKYGVYGAVLGRTVSSLAYFLCIVWYYRKFVKRVAT